MTSEISRKSFLQLGLGLAAAAGSTASATVRPAKGAASATPRPKGVVKTLIRNVDVLTCEIGNKEYHGVDVLLSGGKIAAIAKGLPAGDAEVIDGTGMILMPGFLDGFRHNWQQLNNGLILKTNQSYKSYYTGFNGKVSQAMTPEDYHLAEYLGCIEAIDNGFTSMVDFSQSLRTPEIAHAAIQGAKASGIGGFYAYTPPTPGRGQLPGPAEYKFAETLRDKYFTGSDGMQWGMGMNEPWGRTFADAKAYFAGARATNPGILCMHAGSYGSGGGANGFAGNNAPRPQGTVREVKDFVEAGMLGPDLHMSHGTALTMDELKLMAAHGVTTSSAVLVEYSYGLTESSNHARARAAGCAASFGFDAPVESTRDTFEMARRAFVCMFHDEETIKIADTYQSDDTLAFLTREGHRSARLGDAAGTVTVGKRADLLLLNTDRFGFPPSGIGTMADRVLNFACYHDIDSVWVQGVARKRHGKMLGVDWKSLKAQAAAATDRLYKAVGSPVLGLTKTA